MFQLPGPLRSSLVLTVTISGKKAEKYQFLEAVQSVILTLAKGAGTARRRSHAAAGMLSVARTVWLLT